MSCTCAWISSSSDSDSSAIESLAAAAAEADGGGLGAFCLVSSAIGEDAVLSRPYSRSSVLAASGPSPKRVLRSFGNSADGVGGMGWRLWLREIELGRFESDRLMGVGAGACGKADSGRGLFEVEPLTEVDGRMGTGDCSGVGKGRNNGRSGTVSDADCKLALYRRASLS